MRSGAVWGNLSGETSRSSIGTARKHFGIRTSDQQACNNSWDDGYHGNRSGGFVSVLGRVSGQRFLHPRRDEQNHPEPPAALCEYYCSTEELHCISCCCIHTLMLPPQTHSHTHTLVVDGVALHTHFLHMRNNKFLCEFFLNFQWKSFFSKRKKNLICIKAKHKHTFCLLLFCRRFHPERDSTGSPSSPEKQRLAKLR